MFTGFCIVTSLVKSCRSAPWIARMESSVDWGSVLSFQHLYFGVEGVTLLSIIFTAGRLNPAEYQHQERVIIPFSAFRRRA